MVSSPLSRSGSFLVRTASFPSYASKLARSCVLDTDTLIASGRMGYCWYWDAWME